MLLHLSSTALQIEKKNVTGLEILH